MRSEKPTDYDLASAYLEDRLHNSGVRLMAEFVPQSKSRNRGQTHRSINWIVTLSRTNGMGRTESIESEYMQGIAHVPGYKQHFTGHEWNRQQEIRVANETGKFPTRASSFNLHTRSLPVPCRVDVFASLLLDGLEVENGFAEWCEAYGYDTDSRKALEMFEKCGDIRGKMVRMFGQGTLESYQNDLLEAGL